ncbi:MAG TPA: TetR/AcrR family transcriptional regulator [Pseudolysinimonas sp.]|nr:TetR/AcrR family transcriptional regulator [Pseudolysinimonas sp.]
MSPIPDPPGTPLDPDEVLDAAADAFANDGLDAVTFRRLARNLGMTEADVAAVFESIPRLLAAMLNREYTRMFQAIVDDIERDPVGGRLSRIYRYVLSAVYERPLARSLYLMDGDGLSRIMRLTHGFAYIPQLSVRAEFIEEMKQAGTVRPGVDSRAVSAVISAVSGGAALLTPNPPLSEVVDGLAQLLESGVDTDDADTSRGKATFFAYAQGLSSAPD